MLSGSVPRCCLRCCLALLSGGGLARCLRLLPSSRCCLALLSGSVHRCCLRCCLALLSGGVTAVVVRSCRRVAATMHTQCATACVCAPPLPRGLDVAVQRGRLRLRPHAASITAHPAVVVCGRTVAWRRRRTLSASARSYRRVAATTHSVLHSSPPPGDRSVRPPCWSENS